MGGWLVYPPNEIPWNDPSYARLIFDYPTISSVASYASEQLGAGAAVMAGAGGVGWCFCPVQWFSYLHLVSGEWLI